MQAICATFVGEILFNDLIQKNLFDANRFFLFLLLLFSHVLSLSGLPLRSVSLNIELKSLLSRK